MVVSLVRTDMQYYLGAVAVAVAAYGRQWELVAVVVVATATCSICFWVLSLPSSTLARRGVDASFARFFASLFVWCCIGAIVYTLALCFFVREMGAVSAAHKQRLVLGLSVVLGVSAQDTLGNFAAGLLLVLFRPFRVGDYITVCGQSITVESVTAFFTHGSTIANLHVVLPNKSVIGGTIVNWSSNPSTVLELQVHVKTGQRPCADVRRALTAAAREFDARLQGVVAQCPLVRDPRAALEALPKCEREGVTGPCAITDRGTLWVLKPTVPEPAMAQCTDLGYECILDALLGASIAVFEAPSGPRKN